MMVVLIELHPDHFQWPWLYFKVTAVSNSFQWEFYLFKWLSWNFVWLSITSSRSWIYHYFWFSHMFMGDHWHISSIEKKNQHFDTAFFSDTVKMRSSKLCMIITLLEVYIFIVDLMTLTLFQGHRSVVNIKSKLCFLDSCPL